ncbi:MAG: NADH-quinone oxidoreductase subunit NuoE [Gammaproteobacteria bacterium]
MSHSQSDQPNPTIISDHTKSVIDDCLKKFPADQKQSAILGALQEVQHENKGFITVELMDAVAEYLDMSKIAVYEVASFYSMIETEPVGRHSISVCNNISCMLNGADDLIDHIEKKLQIKTGETTEDGRIFLKQEEECLAACCGAPMMMIDHVYFENLTTEKVDQILDDLE